VTVDAIIERLAKDPGQPLRVPRATYRVQLGPDLTFDDAADVADYLSALGVSDVYTSPFLETSGAGSHGYDVADHSRFRAELGGGAQYGAALDAGQLARQGGRFVLRYYDTVLPIGPRSYARILGLRLEQLNRVLGAEHPAAVELKSIMSLLATIPVRTETDPARLAARRREIEGARARLEALFEDSADVRDFVDANVAIFNGTPGDPRSFDMLDALLDAQVYRLAYWRVAGEEINYRRFFDINELAAIRMEVPEVFAAAHRLLFRLIRDGVVTGLRVDHPDGLYRPAEYFRRLQRGALLEVCHGLFRSAGTGEWRDQDVLARYDPMHAAGAVPAQPFYLVAEKILAPGEQLPETWAVAGTTGDDFLDLLNGIFVDRTQARAIEDLYARVLRARPNFGETVYEAKRLIMDTSMASELNMLAHRLNRISEKHRSSRDFTLGSLRRALREIIAAFPVYRTYLGDDEGSEAGPVGSEAGPVGSEAGPVGSEGAEGGGGGKTPSAQATDRDREYIARAVAAAKRRMPTVDASTFDWVQDILSAKVPEGGSDADRAERRDFVMRFQQITGPTTAKGYEDTALYRYNRLVSLNEVGGEPSRFGTTLAEFHAANVERARDTPYALSATSTHDTKRGEDTRGRIDVRSEVPHEWRAAVQRWQRLNRRHRVTIDGRQAPSANEEYLVYQTLVGAWPIDAERLSAYVLKTAREAKQNTSWTTASPKWDEALTHFVETILDEGTSAEFLRDLREFHAKIAPFGILNSHARLLPAAPPDHHRVRQRLRGVDGGAGPRPGALRTPRGREPVRVPVAGGAARGAGDGRARSPAAPAHGAARRDRRILSLPAVVHRRGRAGLARDDAGRVSRRPRVGRRERRVLPHGGGAHAARPALRRLRRVDPHVARPHRPGGAHRAHRHVHDEPRARARAGAEPRGRRAGETAVSGLPSGRAKPGSPRVQ